MSEDVVHPPHQEDTTDTIKSLLSTHPQLLPRLQGGRSVLRAQLGKVGSPLTDIIFTTKDKLDEALLLFVGTSTHEDFLNAQNLTGQAIALQQYARSPYALIALLKKYEDVLKLCEATPECLSENDVALIHDPAEKHPYERGYEFVAEGNQRMELLQDAVEAGRTDAKYTLGLELNDKSLLRRAAREGNLDAQFEYGKRCLGNDQFEEILGAAKQGHANAQNYLGDMYLNGKGVTQSDVEAFKWYKKAAEQGHVDAESIIAYMYNYGRGVTQSDTEAFRWTIKAADQGDESAQRYLAYRCKTAADQGHADAQYYLGCMYYIGHGMYYNHGVIRDGTIIRKSETEAFKWFEKAAYQGHAYAQSKLGYMYKTGKGVRQSDAEAAKWYEKLGKGHLDAQHSLGFRYTNKEGVILSNGEVAKWYKKVVEQANSDAQTNLG